MSEWIVQLQTQGRHQAIDVSVGVASGFLPSIFHQAGNFPVVILSGHTIKSLAAEAMIASWKNSARTSPFNIPLSNKMSFERTPCEAGVKAIRRVKKFSGQKVRVHFDSRRMPITSEALQEDQDRLLTKPLRGRCGGVILKSIGGALSSSGLASLELSSENAEEALFSGASMIGNLSGSDSRELIKMGEEDMFWSRRWSIDVRDERLQTEEMKLALQALSEKYPVSPNCLPI